MEKLGAVVFGFLIVIVAFSTPVQAAAGPDVSPDTDVIEAEIGSQETGLTVLIDYSLLNPLTEGDFVFATYGYANERRVIQLDIRIQREGGQLQTQAQTDLALPF